MEALAPYLKAFTAAVVAGLAAASTGLVDGSFSWQDGLATAISFFVALGAVYQVPNTPKPAPTPLPAKPTIPA